MAVKMAPAISLLSKLYILSRLCLRVFVPLCFACDNIIAGLLAVELLHIELLLLLLLLYGLCLYIVVVFNVITSIYTVLYL